MTGKPRPEDDPRRQRAERLAEALRTNLRRRKQQARARAGAEPDAADPPAPTDAGAEPWTG